MSISIDNKPVSEFSDTELLAWVNNTDGYKIRANTASLWVSVIRAFDEAGPPMTVRQIYYALVSRGAIEKTEEAYKLVCYQVLQMRRRGKIPYSFVSDNTRWMRKPKTYDSLDSFLTISQEGYRRALWANQKDYVEIWIEKDALAGVAYEITQEFDVPLMVTRGFPSETFVHEAAEAIKAQGKPTYIYYFGDYDPSGVAIPENTRDKLKAFGADVHFHVKAVLPWQIQSLKLPTRPTKKSDTRAKGWEGGSVELDAIPVNTLRFFIRMAIESHIDADALAESERIEQLEKETFSQFVKNFRLAPNSPGGVL